MEKLKSNDLKKINGGGVSATVGILIGAGIVFLIGLIFSLQRCVLLLCDIYVWKLLWFNGTEVVVVVDTNLFSSSTSFIISKRLFFDFFCKYLRSRSLVDDDDVDGVGVCFGKVDKELSGDFVLMSSWVFSKLSEVLKKCLCFEYDLLRRWEEDDEEDL